MVVVIIHLLFRSLFYFKLSSALRELNLVAGSDKRITGFLVFESLYVYYGDDFELDGLVI